MSDEPQKTPAPIVTEEEPKEEPKEETLTEVTSTSASPQRDGDKTEEYLNNWKRERADFLNYKKDEARRVEEFVKFANEDVVLEAMEIVDDLELAVQEYKDIGLEQIIKKFKDLFRKYGVEEIKVTGEKFNPALHEAVETHSASSGQAEAGGEKIVQVRAGYTMHSKVIRPARVKIIK